MNTLKFSIDHEDLFLLHAEVKELYAFSEKHKGDSIALLFGGRKQIKAVKKMFDYLVRYRFNPQKLYACIRESIQRLNLLFHALTKFEYIDWYDRKLSDFLVAFLKKLEVLLPQGECVQLWLFDKDALEDVPEKKRYLPGFCDWKRQRCRFKVVVFVDSPCIRPVALFRQLSFILWRTPAPLSFDYNH
jgi:hypothetical protein